MRTRDSLHFTLWFTSSGSFYSSLHHDVLQLQKTSIAIVTLCKLKFQLHTLKPGCQDIFRRIATIGIDGVAHLNTAMKLGSNFIHELRQCKSQNHSRGKFSMVGSTATALRPLEAVNAWERQDKTQYKGTCTKFSDLWHQGDQTRQSDYVFCEPPKRDGLDTLMKKMWQGPPLLLEHRSYHYRFPAAN